MIFVFYFFAAVLTFLAYKSLVGGINYLNFFKQELAKSISNFTAFSSIIAPCRGLDDDLETNLDALFEQNFPAYEIIFVVDDASDESVAVIEKLIAENTRNSVSAKLVVAGKAKNESQKVHNLRQAVLEVSERSEIFIFVDSDARPNKDWLRNLIAPLQDEKIGCASGYRWFVQKRGGLSTHLRSVWNASIASSLGANTKGNFCWGGSTAIRRETFERLEMHEQWRGTLSDDFVVTRAMKEANLPIFFVPQCLTATVEDCSFGEFLEFSTRQMKITRVYAAHLWQSSLVGSMLFTVNFYTGTVLLFFLSGVHFWLTVLFVVVNFTLGCAKAFLRWKAVKTILVDYEKELNQQFLPHVFLWAITPPIYFYNSVCALFSRKIRWRGIEYELWSATETRVISTNKPLR